MSIAYRPVQWNRHKRIYDAILVAGVAAYLVGFVVVNQLIRPAPRQVGPAPILLLRATGTCAFVMLHLILMIGPLARLS